MLGNARKNKPVQIKSREKSLRPFIFRWSNQIPLDPLSKWLNEVQEKKLRIKSIGRVYLS